MIYYKKQWFFLTSGLNQNQLSHAYLFSGLDYEGKKIFTQQFAKYIYCLSVKKPCNNCSNCFLIEKNNFPDILLIKSANSRSSIKNEKDMMEIDIDQARQISNFLGYKSYYGGYKTVIVDNAERMNSQSQNSFLKTLEEPKGKSLILLLCSHSERLLPTVVSRCQELTFFASNNHKESKEEKNILFQFIKLINADLVTKFHFAKKINLEEDNFGKILQILQKYFRSLLLKSLDIPVDNVPSPLKNYTISQIKQILLLMEKLRYHYFMNNLNHKLALEILLMEF